MQRYAQRHRTTIGSVHFGACMLWVLVPLHVPLHGAAPRCLWQRAVWSLGAGGAAGFYCTMSLAACFVELGCWWCCQMCFGALWSLGTGAVAGCGCKMSMAVRALEPPCLLLQGASADLSLKNIFCYLGLSGAAMRAFLSKSKAIWFLSNLFPFSRQCWTPAWRFSTLLILAAVLAREVIVSESLCFAVMGSRLSITSLLEVASNKSWPENLKRLGLRCVFRELRPGDHISVSTRGVGGLKTVMHLAVLFGQMLLTSRFYTGNPVCSLSWVGGQGLDLW